MASHAEDHNHHYQEETTVLWDTIRLALEENQDWYRDLVEHSHILLSIHDLEGRLLSVNPVPARLLGYSVEEMLQRPLRDCIDPQFRGEFDDYLREIARTGESRGLMTVVTRAGERRTWEYRSSLRREGVARPIVRTIAHDVTERVRAEKALRLTNQELLKVAQERERMLGDLTLFRTLLDQTHDAIQVVEPETLRLLDMNERTCQELGYSREELLSMTVYDIAPEFDQRVRADVLRQLQERGFAIIERVHRRKDGSTFPVEVTLREVQLDRKYGVTVTRDITARKRAEQQLREYEQVVEGLDELIVVVDRNYRYLLANRAFLLYRGLTKEQVVGHSVAENLDPGTFDHLIRKKMDQCFAGKIVQYEMKYRYPNLGERDIFVSYFPIAAPGGVDRIACVLQDITGRKQSEARQQEYERVVEGLEEMYVVVDRDYRYVLANHAYLQYRGLRSEQVVGRPLSEVLDKNLFATLVKDKIDESFTGKVVRYQKTDNYPNLGERHLSVSYFPIQGAQGVDRIAVILKDITEQTAAEKALRESEERFRAVYERSPLGISLVDSLTGKFLQVNPKFCEITGRSQEELLRSDVRSITHPDDVERDIENLQQLAEEKLAHYEMEKRYLRPDGSVRWVRLLVTRMWTQGDHRRWEMGLMEDITERKRSEEAISTLVQVPANSSENFFTSMAVQLAKCLAADHTYIGELIAGENGKDKDRVRTLGVCSKGALANNIFYDLPNSPCAEVLEQGTCSYVSGVVARFPRDFVLQQLQVEGYVGTSLRDSQGRVVGIMAAAYQRPLANPKFAETILQLFSTRTAAEIERKRTEEALRQSEVRFQVAIKNSPITVFSQDVNLRYTWVYNPTLSHPSSDMMGKDLHEFWGREQGDAIAKVRRRVLETGVGLRHEVQVTHGGRKHYFDTTIEPVFDAAGVVVGLTGASMDVTELREATEALREAQKRLREEKVYLEREIDTELGFGEIIGRSKALQEVMENVAKVAASDATVLLLGETGTGKELVARAIHRLSQRADTSFIKMNCAAIPSGLLESELFGNEKGAFTGAVSRKIGRLELADKGTLFLDEIGEIPLDLQPKLLRVLQDQEFERLGGMQTIKVDFRLIAATNRNLVAGVRENEFRSDLYYRLNVFPIRVPPLRERREDIRLLVEHFVQKFARRMKRSITSIPTRTIDALMGWDWPGNVRELENFIERSVILTQGSVLVSPLSELELNIPMEKRADETLKAAERQLILRALRESHGQIGGPDGAAQRLGLKRTTLQSKLKHLGINPRAER